MRPGKLIIHNIKERTEIEIVTRINPRNNLELSGLYMSKNNYITQCESEGFRRITYFPDRPDILAKYRVVIRAPKDYKDLLSNGNLVEQENCSTDATMPSGKIRSRNPLTSLPWLPAISSLRAESHLVRRPRSLAPNLDGTGQQR